MAESQDFERCAAHGLRIDPKHGGCVLCRRSTAPAPASSSRHRVILFIGASVLALVALVLAIVWSRGKEQRATVTQQNAEPAEEQTDEKPNAEEEQGNVTRRARGIALTVPASFEIKTRHTLFHGAVAKRSVSKLMTLVSVEHGIIQIAKEPSWDFDKGVELSEYTERIRKALADRPGANIGSAQPASIGQDEALRFTVELSIEGVLRKGYCYAIKRGSNFLQFIILSVPSDFAYLESTLVPAVENATLE